MTEFSYRRLSIPLIDSVNRNDSVSLPIAEMKKVHIEVKGTATAAQKPAEDQENGSEGDDEDEDEDEEDEDDDEEESEEEKESSNKTAPNKARKEPSSESSSESDSDDDRSKEERLYDKAKQRIEVELIERHRHLFILFLQQDTKTHLVWFCV